MRKFNVLGMSCAACSARVEKAVSALKNVDECNVNLLNNTLSVVGNATNDEIIAAVTKAGYSASLYKPKNDNKNGKYKAKIINLLISFFLLGVLMYFSMGNTMWGFPLPHILSENYRVLGMIQLVLTVAIMLINRHFFVSGFKSVVNKSLNMDTLVALGSISAFIYSIITYVKFFAEATFNVKHLYMHELYFESSAMILTLISLGKLLESYSKGKTTSAINSLFELAPKLVTVIENGIEKCIPADKIKIGDIFLVHPGEIVAADGVITDGNTSVDESVLTGESIPVNKSSGDTVYTATHNINGFIKCKATADSTETFLSKIIATVNDASATKAPIARIADKVAAYFVPAVILIAVITVAVWLIIGYEFGFALSRGISVLVISCPCALGLATPVAIMVGNGVAAKSGILFKTATALEETGKCENILLDKTGTVTYGKPFVTDILSFKSDKNELLQIAYSVEKASVHPLAVAICNKAHEIGLSELAVTDFKEMAGKGISAKLGEDSYFFGNEKSILEYCNINTVGYESINKLSNEGQTSVIIAKNGQLFGIISFSDTVRQDSIYAIEQLKKMGIAVTMLTGDNEAAAKSIGTIAHVDNVIFGVLPDNKARYVKSIKEGGFTVMVGDGINDAPALTTANIGMAIGSGTDIAIESADVVLMKNSLLDAVNAITISKATLKNIKLNLFWAFFYNVLSIPIAAGLLIPFGIQLNPMIAATAMSFSSIFVICNALRLNFLKIKKYVALKEKNYMEKTMIINGMMCEHCSARVNGALSALDSVDSVVISLADKKATVTLKGEISDTLLIKAVEEQGYKVTEIY